MDISTPSHKFSQQEVEDRIKRLQGEQIRRLMYEAMHSYDPNERQLECHMSVADIRALLGGNQSGKTFAGTIDMAWTVGGVHPYRPNYLGRVFGRDSCVDYGRLEGVLLPTYQNILPVNECLLPGKTFEGNERVWPGLKGGSWEKAYDTIRHILYLANGSFFEFMSYDQGWKRFQGPQRHICRFDEAPEDERIFNECIARQITLPRLNILLTFTPLNYATWLFSRLVEGAAKAGNIELFYMPSRMNKFANQQILKFIEENVDDEYERAARLEGEWVLLKGLIYPGYGPHNECRWFRIPDHWHRSFVIDPHPQKPTAVNWFATDPKDWKTYGYREADLSGDTDFICQEIRSLSEAEMFSLILIDPSSRARNAQDGRDKPLLHKYREHFPTIVPAINNVDVGIDAVRAAIHDGPNGAMLRFLDSCPVTRSQMKAFSWKPPTATGEDRTKPAVLKKNEDHCDNVRYRMAQDAGRFVGKTFNGFGMSIYGG